MFLNESEEGRLLRLQKYRICQATEHELAYALSGINVCVRCRVHYRFVLQEDPTTLPTGINRMIPGTNVSEWKECPVEVVFP